MKTAQTILELLSSKNTIAKVRDWLRKNKDKGRHALAQYLCGALNITDHWGNPRISGVYVALRLLESRGFWKLPKLRAGVASQQQPRRMTTAVPAPKGVPAQVEEVQGLRLVEVSTGEDQLFRTWNELILTEHPLEDCRLVGRQLRYLIGSDHGWLGAIGFGSCALHLRARDEWIEWDPSTRKRFQERLINMTRFLIRPQVRCENLASRVLSLCAERVASDFAARYGFEPWLMESFVDTEQQLGTSYQAANWSPIGTTAGLGRNARGNRPSKTPKAIYFYELTRDWRSRMGLPPLSEKIKPVAVEEAFHNGNWVEAEFGKADLGHEDRNQRFVRIVTAKAQQPSAPYTQCFSGNRHELKAYYRLIDSKAEEVNPESMLQGHRERTIGRMKKCRRVLGIQDTTDLDFSERLHCNGLGDIGKNQTGAVSQGLKMHSLFAVSEAGVPLGVLKIQFYASHYAETPKAQDRPIEEKETYRWLSMMDSLKDAAQYLPPEIELIGVGDRESDMFELFDYRRRKAPRVPLLVRAKHNRCLEENSRKLFDHLTALPVMAQARIAVPRQREKKSKPSKPGRVALAARTAQVDVKWDKVTLSPPDTAQTRELQPVEVYALSVVERRPPEGAKEVRWVLLTTVPIRSRKEALRCLRWYTLRWRIEEWHRVMKSGCRIESHQHQTADRLARAICIDAVIGWRVMLLALLGREVPEMPCELMFSRWECSLLEKLQPLVAPETVTGKKKLCFGVAITIISRLGGALNRNGKEPPGPQTLLRGLKRFQDIALGARLLGGEITDMVAMK